MTGSIFSTISFLVSKFPRLPMSSTTNFLEFQSSRLPISLTPSGGSGTQCTSTLSTAHRLCSQVSERFLSNFNPKFLRPFPPLLYKCFVVARSYLGPIAVPMNSFFEYQEHESYSNSICVFHLDLVILPPLDIWLKEI